MGANNHPTVTPANHRLTERQVAERIGREYHETEYDGEVPAEVEEAAKLLKKMNDYLYDAIFAYGVEVIFTSDDPYGSYEEMVADIEANDRLFVFNGGTHPDHISKVDNLKNRAVHDFWGHYKNDVDFTFWGEFQKWHHMKRWYPEPVHRLTLQEVVGQTGLCWYLEGGFSSPDFKQKSFLAPTEWADLCYRHFPGKLPL
ncbi:hypothetical protein [Haloferax larsenii]|nr:hypothetical protein [Haloferax larsenii]